MTAALLKLRSSTNDLKSRGIVPSSTLGILEEEIGWALTIVNKTEEARDLLKQAVSDLKQSSAKNPEDKEARFYLAEALFFSGCLAEFVGQLEDALSCFEQAAAIHMDCEPSDSEYASLTGLYRRLQRLADRLGQLGRTGEEDRSRRSSQWVLQHLLGSDPERWTDASPPGLETLGRLFQRDDLKKTPSHENEQIRHSEPFVTNWLVLSVGPLSPFRSSSSAATYDRDPEAGAVALIAAIRDRCSKLGFADSMVLAAMSVVWNDAAELAVEQRRLGRLDDARATAARLMALARRLVREYPDGALAYRVLSEAHNQIKKNALQTGDDHLVEESLVQAVEAAQRSLALDPDCNETRHHLEKLTAQLASIKAERNAKGSPLP
jgi:tetratricopeptide (TPR) repeat protein